MCVCVCLAGLLYVHTYVHLWLHTCRHKYAKYRQQMNWLGIFTRLFDKHKVGNLEGKEMKEAKK